MELFPGLIDQVDRRMLMWVVKQWQSVSLSGSWALVPTPLSSSSGIYKVLIYHTTEWPLSWSKVIYIRGILSCSCRFLSVNVLDELSMERDEECKCKHVRWEKYNITNLMCADGVTSWLQIHRSTLHRFFESITIKPLNMLNCQISPEARWNRLVVQHLKYFWTVSKHCWSLRLLCRCDK